MKKTKTFKIGKSAIGGIVKVSIIDGCVFIRCLDWNTKKEVKFQSFTSFEESRILMYLEDEVTSYFFAEKIINWLKEQFQ